LATKASCSTTLAPSTSPCIHFSLAPISQSISDCGQYVTARRRRASRRSGVPCSLSRSAARLQSPFFEGKTVRACARVDRAVSTLPRLSNSSASATQVAFLSSSSTPRPAVAPTMAAHVAEAGG